MKNFDQLTEPSESEKLINGKESGDEIFEDIEAPKFVDFTVPDHYLPDDRYWFCLRVGCDQKHEEELDLEEINKNFVLRVMAARSPNIKIRKMLNRKQQSSTLKCPLTAPAKPSRPRISRLAVISSISRKLIEAKDKAKPRSKPTISKQSNSSKAFTTPRNRKRLSNSSEKFRSVRNPKPAVTDIVGPKSRVVAKALVFNSPPPKKKVESKTPVAKLCLAMSKLEIKTEKKKRPLGSKVSTTTTTINTPVGKLCSAMKKLEIKSGKKSELGLDKTPRRQFRGREVKSRVFDSLKSHVRERKNEPKSSKKRKEMEKDNDSRDMEIDERSKQASSEEKVNSSEAKTIDNDDKENALPLDEAENVSEEEEEVNESDEKENALASDGNSEPKDNSEKKILTNHDLNKVKEVIKKPLKKSSVAQDAKYRKPKPTNPKPFRLRTDERGILKEATMEKKLATPLREITTATVKPLGIKLSRKNPTPSRTEDENVKTDPNQPRKTSTSDKISEKTRSPKKPVRPQGTGMNRKAIVLGVIKERSEPTILKHKDSVKPSGKSVSQGIVKGVPRSVSRGRLATTIPKEPNFHSIHVPKSCTKKVT